MMDRDYMFAVHMHLYDLLLRMLFQTVGFEGRYDPPVILGPSHMPVDWVTPERPPKDLGYGEGRYG